MKRNELPVVVIGAGPVGLAAAAHLLARGIDARVLEAGPAVGASIASWAHVRTFSPWEFNIDRASAALLARQGWRPPPADRFPTGREIVERYLQPLAQTPELAPRIFLGTRVTAVTRRHVDLMKNATREDAPFVVRFEREGLEDELLARGVIDASGTWTTPNPLGSSGLPAIGETALNEHVAYGIPDVLGANRARYAGRRVLVVGSGHSAFNVLQDLAVLAEQVSGGAIHWAVRRTSLARVLGGGENDALAERGRLGLRIKQLVNTGAIKLRAGFRLDRLVRQDDGIVAFDAGRAIGPVDEVIGVTGFRPDLTPLRELRLDLDPATQSPRALAPLIDPNVHSCGTVRPHGAEELRHPEADLYVVGMKSYGRAPTFLLLTGYEQVRSVAAALAGDWDAARRVELVLPETGVCSTDFDSEGASGGCCGTPAPVAAKASAAASTGCGTGCGTARPAVVLAEQAAVAGPADTACCDGAKPNAGEPFCDQPADARSEVCCTTAPQAAAVSAPVRVSACCA